MTSTNHSYSNEDILAQFKDDEDFENWVSSLIEVKAEDAWDFEPDSENVKRLTTSIQLNERLFEGYQKLAVEKGRSGLQPLIILALEEYLTLQATPEKVENASD